MGELELGSDAYGDATAVTYEAGESVSPGDVVAIDGGQVVAANSGVTAEDNPVGVVAEAAGSSISSGDEISVYLTGSGVVCSVADAVSAGTELGASATDGQLASGSDGWEAISDEGADAGAALAGDVPSGGAVVKLP